MYFLFLLWCYDLIFKLIPCTAIMPWMTSWPPNWIWIFSRCHPASNSKNKHGQQVQGEKKYSLFDFMIDFFHWKVFLTFLTVLYFWSPTDYGDTIWILTTKSAINISVYEARPCFLPILPYFFKSSLIFFYQKSSPITLTARLSFLHAFFIFICGFPLTWSFQPTEARDQWDKRGSGGSYFCRFVFEELFLILDCMVYYWFLLSMALKTAVLKYCYHSSKRPGFRLATGSVCIFVLNLVIFLMKHFLK